jgi:dihydrofolate reductase
MANHVYIATSLDGFIATAEGGIEWLSQIPNPKQSDYGYAKFMRGIDAIVIGRKTYEKVLTFECWPYDKPVFILSRTLREVPESIADKAEIVSGDIEKIVTRLHQQDHRHLYIDGGQTIQSFLAADAIDELIITHVPILLGKGIPLFGKLDKSLKFSHRKTEIFNNVLVQSQYKRER